MRGGAKGARGDHSQLASSAGSLLDGSGRGQTEASGLEDSPSGSGVMPEEPVTHAGCTPPLITAGHITLSFTKLLPAVVLSLFG